MGQPETRFASADGVNIGYQVLGDGPVDLVWAWGLASNIEVVWEEPGFAALLHRLADHARLILFDRRGCGVSDRHGDTATASLDELSAARARVALDALVDELTAAYGLGGRARRTPDRIERARKAVTRRIRDALGRIDRAHPVLGRHLRASVSTGVFCSYAPERDVAWEVEVHR